MRFISAISWGVKTAKCLQLTNHQQVILAHRGTWLDHDPIGINKQTKPRWFNPWRFCSPNVGHQQQPIDFGSRKFTITKKVTIAELLGKHLRSLAPSLSGVPLLLTGWSRYAPREPHLMANVVSLEHFCRFSNPKKGNLRLHNQVYHYHSTAILYEIWDYRQWTW